MPAAHYHLHAVSATVASGLSGAEHYAYIAREGKYADPDQASEDLVAVFSENMPAWAAEDPALYWFAADQFERDNGVIYKEIEFAIPHGLTPEQRIEVALEMARDRARTSDGKVLPFTLAVHAGKDGANWNAHLMVSERINDGIERDPEKWFSRAATSPRKRDKTTGELLPAKKQIDASKGGAKKTKELRPKDWLLATRARWAELANEALARAGREERLDHRSLADQGVAREPQIHLGRKAFEMEKAFQEGKRKRGSDRAAINRRIIETNNIMADESRAGRTAELEAAYAEAQQLGAVMKSNNFLHGVSARIEQKGTAGVREHYVAIACDAVFGVGHNDLLYGEGSGFRYLKDLQDIARKSVDGVTKGPLKGLADVEIRRTAEGLKYTITARPGCEKQFAALLREAADRQFNWDSAVLRNRARPREKQPSQEQSLGR